MKLFISYSHMDHKLAHSLALELEERGYSVWWDKNLLGGDNIHQVIRSRIEDADRVFVLWSTNSVKSDFVLGEAKHAKRLNKLVPLRLDTVDLPYDFGSLKTIDMAIWPVGFREILKAIAPSPPQRIAPLMQTPSTAARPLTRTGARAPTTLKIPVRRNADTNEARRYEKTLIEFINRDPNYIAFSQGFMENTLPYIDQGIFLEAGDPKHLPHGVDNLLSSLSSEGLECRIIQGPWKNDPSAFRFTIGWAG